MFYVLLFIAVGYLAYSQGQYDGMKKLCGENNLVEDENHKLYCNKDLGIQPLGVQPFIMPNLEVKQLG